jgi:hypothetical protein
MAVNWNMLAAYPNAGEAFAQSWEKQQETNKQNMGRNALAALVQNPNDPQALAALAKVAPEQAMQFRSQQATLAKTQLAEHQEHILTGSQIIREMKPHDQASWTATLQAAQRAGVPVSELGVPMEWNDQTAQYAQQLVGVADALKPQAENDVQNIPYQAGGGVLQYDKRTGTVHELVAPNDGSHPSGAPAGGAITATGPNGQKIQLNQQTGQWEPIGGPTPQASGGFR